MQLQQLLAVKSTQHRNSAADTKITAQLRAATAGIRRAGRDFVGDQTQWWVHVSLSQLMIDADNDRTRMLYSIIRIEIMDKNSIS